MTKANFFILTILMLISFSSCQAKTTSSVSDPISPESIKGLEIQFITYKVNDHYNEEFLNTTATYHFASSNQYSLYLSGKLHSTGYYAYKKKSKNTGIMTLSYSSYSGTGDYSVIFIFHTGSSGNMKASSHGSNIDDFEASFKVI